MADAETPAPVVEQGNPVEPAIVTETPAVEPAKTVLEGGADPTTPVTPDWPEDWRDKLAKTDAKLRTRLDRFKSPADVLTAYTELEKRMSSAKVKLPDTPTEEQLAAYRKDNGIPDKPDGYLAALPPGLVIGDEDKPLVQSFLDRVHGKNAPPEVVADAVDWFYAAQEEKMAEQAAQDKEFRVKSEDALRAEWGGEFRGNINSITAFLDAAPATEDGTPLKDLLMGARLSDGTPLGNHPTALKWLAQIASDANPAGFVSPGVGGSQAESVESEIATIENRMRTDRPGYMRDEPMQARYRQLLTAREKLAR